MRQSSGVLLKLHKLMLLDETTVIIIIQCHGIVCQDSLRLKLKQAYNVMYNDIMALTIYVMTMAFVTLYSTVTSIDIDTPPWRKGIKLNGEGTRTRRPRCLWPERGLLRVRRGRCWRVARVLVVVVRANDLLL